MDPINQWKHEVLQRLIIIFLGLLTLGAAMQSCGTTHASCSAYGQRQQCEIPK
jgi:hypothetical protein